MDVWIEGKREERVNAVFWTELLFDLVHGPSTG
jgi:hypothetical protein